MKKGGKTEKERRSMLVGRVVCIAFWKSWELSQACCVSFSGRIQTLCPKQAVDTTFSSLPGPSGSLGERHKVQAQPPQPSFIPGFEMVSHL